MRRPIRVAIVDPHDGIRDALRQLLADEADLQVTAFRDVGTFVAASRAAHFDVALADERVAGASPSAARTMLGVISERVPVVVMGMGEPDYYADAMTAAGAVGYWPKFGDVDVLVQTIRAAGLVGASDAVGARPIRHAPARRRVGTRARPIRTST
jgi:DNA-binding NarL/FixJ family response regulator